MSAPAWQYHEPDHPGADFDALAAAHRRRKVYAVGLSAGIVRYAEKKARMRSLASVEFLQGPISHHRHKVSQLF
jgi:hypothetical protein